MRPTVETLSQDIEDKQRELQAVRQREIANKRRALESAVERAADALHRHESRIAWSEQRIEQLRETVLVLARRDDTTNVESLLTECYTSIAALTAMLDDAERVTEHLQNALTDAQLQLK